MSHHTVPAGMSAVDDFIIGGGEMGARMRAFDWSATSLGSAEYWPQSLRTAVSILLNSMYPMFLAWGRELNFLYNDAYRPILGGKHPHGLGTRFADLWSEIWPAISPLVERALAGEPTWSEDLLLIMERKGFTEETYFTFSYSPIRDEAGAVGGMFCACIETTGRVLSERRVSTLQALGAAGVESRTIGDAEQRCLHALETNQHDVPFALLYRFDRSTARLVAAANIDAGAAAAPHTIELDDDGAPWPLQRVRLNENVIVSDLAERFGEANLPASVWEDPTRAAIVLPIAGRNQAEGALVLGISPRRTFDGPYRDFLSYVAASVTTAIANARAYEEERQRAEALAELDRAKTAFFSNVSHEFRTPLTLMLGPAEDLLNNPDADADAREIATVIHRNALRLLKLVNGMLEVSRIESNRIEARYEVTSFPVFTAELASTFRSAVEKAGLRFHVDVTPANADDAPVYVDQDMWEKVVLNLLSNAFKHTFHGEIAVRAAVDSERAVLTVSDTGIGIPHEHLPRIFDRFHRVPDARARTFEGTGIGLALVQELVRLHGGTIDVQSVVGAGTTFTVQLPVGREHLPAKHVVGATAEGTQRVSSSASYIEEALRWLPADLTNGVEEVRETDFPQPRLLVVDDNADMRDYLGRLLRGHGWRVDVASDGDSALEHIRTQPPDVVLTDVMMPGLSGVELLHALREDEPTRTLPVILVSARAGEEARLEGLGAGASDYIVKPFSAKEMIARVEATLRRSREAAAVLDAVKSERRRLQALFEQAPAFIAVLRGPDHVYEAVNPECLRLIGRKDVVGKSVREVLGHRTNESRLKVLDDVYRTGVPYVANGLRFVVEDDNGTPREIYLNLVYQPMFEDGAVTGIFAHGVDVTAHIRALEEVETANRAKLDFLRSMSHELRTPLNAIGGYIQLIEMGVHGPINDAQREALVRVHRSQQHLLSLINDVLNFAKVEAGRVEYDLEPLRLADAVVDVIQMLSPQAKVRGITLERSIDAALSVIADREKLEQIMLNLLSNALKFTPPGGRVTFTAERSTGDQTIALHVSDTGIGIDAEKLEAIFDPFVQVKRDLTNTSEGTGLGLAISRDLARGMNGDLTAASIVSEGSTFTLTLPAA